MKKYLIEFLKDIGIEPNFIAMSISILTYYCNYFYSNPPSFT